MEIGKTIAYKQQNPLKDMQGVLKSSCVHEPDYVIPDPAMGYIMKIKLNLLYSAKSRNLQDLNLWHSGNRGLSALNNELRLTYRRCRSDGRSLPKDLNTGQFITSSSHHHLNQLMSIAGNRSFVPQYTVPGRLPPTTPSDSPDVICPPRWGPTTTLRLPARGRHSSTLRPQRPSVLRAMCPAHCHFSFATH
ncbi:jg8783 [Pararge aegeria aegeria]|uniref:Jg8783 protein n=1 Tax=Pararge aegeria aegeria TaxID=348720 RepID=A0A8S4S343_9NEOP|nr:jg8783 [Pararge aegeria aegeria]